MLLLMKAGFLFGYAKPVPVNFNRLHKPRRDMVFVAAAGAAINLVMALAAASCITELDLFSPQVGVWLFANIGNAITLNVMLAVFNMLPIRLWTAAASQWACFPMRSPIRWPGSSARGFLWFSAP